MSMSKSNYIICFIIFLIIASCNLPTREELLDETKNALWAVPLINDEIKIQDLFTSEDPDNATRIYSNSEGKVFVSYEGEVLNDPASVVFPPIFGFGNIILADTFFQLDLAMGVSGNSIDSAVFLQDQLNFNFISSSKVPLTVTVYIDEIVKDGKKLSQTVFFPGSPDGKEVTIVGEFIKLNGWSLKGNNNIITFHYDARTSTNERVLIDRVSFAFNILQFSYLQGYFPQSSRPVIGSFIPINLYNRWIGGTMNFVEPKVAMTVENSFGFAVGTDFKEMSIENLEGVKLNLESEIIDNGLIFNYPGFDEMNVVKYTNFEFNKNNSNIAIIFNDRVAKFNYAIDAVANPLGDPDFLGYMTDKSYYSVQVKVEVPMHLAINNLQLVDTFDVNINFEDNLIDTAEIKMVLENNFPLDVTAQFYMLDEKNNVIDSIFSDGPIFLKGGTYNGNSELTNVGKQEIFIDFPSDKISNLKNTKRILAKPTFVSTPNGLEPLWIYDSYGLKVKMGAKFSLE